MAVAQLETRVEEMQQLEVQLVQFWELAKLTEVVVAELRKKLESRVTNLEQWNHDVVESVNAGVDAVEGRFVNLERWSDDIAEDLNAVHDRVENLEHRWGAGCRYPAELRRTASPHWWTFLLATETGSAVPQTQFIDRVVVLPGVL